MSQSARERYALAFDVYLAACKVQEEAEKASNRFRMSPEYWSARALAGEAWEALQAAERDLPRVDRLALDVARDQEPLHD